MRVALISSLVAFTLFVPGCASERERHAFAEWVDASHHFDRPAEPEFAVPPGNRADRTEADPPPVVLLDTADLDEYLAYAVRHSPALQSAFYRWKAALERIPQARSLAEPQLTFAYFVEQAESQGDPTGERYGLAQMFPWFGTLALRGDVALEEALAEQRRFEAERLALVYRVSRAFHEHRYLHRAIDIATEQRELAAHLERVALARFRAGTAGQSDVIRAQVELGRLDDQVRSLQDLRGPVAADLNAAMGRATQAPLPPPRSASTEQLPSEPRVLSHSDEQLLAMAGRISPELQALQHQIARERRAIELARKDYWPDFMLGVEYARNASARMAMMDGGGADMVMGMIRIDVPIWREKYDAAVAEALARFGSASRNMIDRRNTLETELQRAIYAFRDAGRKIDLYGRTLVPKAREALRSTETSYRAGQTSFSDLVDAQRVLLEFALSYERALADHHQMLAQIEMLVGRSVATSEPAASSQDRIEPPADEKRNGP